MRGRVSLAWDASTNAVRYCVIVRLSNSVVLRQDAPGVTCVVHVPIFAWVRISVIAIDQRGAESDESNWIDLYTCPW